MEQRTFVAFVSCQQLRGMGERRRHMEGLVEETKAGESWGKAAPQLYSRILGPLWERSGRS